MFGIGPTLFKYVITGNRSFKGGGGGGVANYGWGFRPAIRKVRGGGEVYTTGTIRKAGGGGEGELLSRRGGGTLYERATL